MPLLTSPVDGSPMKQISRFGIEIDVCPTTGGVWLDKGELEKLMAMIREAAAEEQGNFAPAQAQKQQRAVYEEPRREQYQEPRREKYADQRYDSRSDHGRHPHHKKSRFSDILDIFDFG